MLISITNMNIIYIIRVCFHGNLSLFVLSRLSMQYTGAHINMYIHICIYIYIYIYMYMYMYIYICTRNYIDNSGVYVDISVVTTHIHLFLHMYIVFKHICSGHIHTYNYTRMKCMYTHMYSVPTHMCVS